MRAWSVVFLAVAFLVLIMAFQEAFLFRVAVAGMLFFAALWCWDRADKREAARRG